MLRAAVQSRVVALALVLGALSATDCSGVDESAGQTRSDAPSERPGSGADASTGTGGSDFGNVGMPEHAGTSSSAEDAGAIDPGTDECVGETQSAKRVPVDMYIMLDRSDSMRGVTGTGATKWDAMRSALTMFITDPESEGLGVGLQYFPLGAPDVPESCKADTECGTNGGACTNRVCRPPPLATSFVPVVCLSDAECPRSSPGCMQMGVCSLSDTMACFNIGAGGCQTDGDCVLLPGQCTTYASCKVSDYSDPAVPVAVLPDNAPPLTASLMSENPIGLTPTPAALAGAIERASLHAADYPTHRVIAVLATDGLPTVCVDPTVQTVEQAVAAVAQIAAAGLARMPSVETYVIGVFSPDEEALDPVAKLNSIALAGGTEQAFIVDASQDVAQQLLDALAEIRGGTLDCEFQLPDPPKGETLDYQLVNVQVTSEGNPRDLFYVRTADDCDKAELGWFYDVEPERGGTPTQIQVCEQTCTAFRALPDASVKIKLGCATRGPD